MAGLTLTGSISDISFDINGNPRVTITVNEKRAFLAGIDSLREQKLTFVMKKYYPKRSLDANAYFWTLLDKLTVLFGLPSIQLYKEFIKDVGGNSDIVCVQNAGADRLCRGWGHNGLGWVTERMPSKLDNCTNVILYYGSSSYDSAQMSRLINLAVDECKQHGIQTATPAELSLLLEAWK